MKSELRWIIVFIVIEIIWVTILTSTIYQEIYKLEILDNMPLFLATIPLIIFVMVYFMALIFVYFVYIITFSRVKSHQLCMLKDKNELLSTADPNVRQQSTIKYSRYKQNPLCSIVIPSRNEEKVIKKTVENCLEQTYPNIEIIVICHNCQDRTFEEANVAHERVRVFNLRTEETGKGIALNYGTEKANGDYVLILDGDGKLSRDFIEKSLPLFKEDVTAVQGAYIPSNREYNLLTRLLSIEGDLWSTPYMTVRSFLYKRVYLGGTGYIIRRNRLLQIGGFMNHLVDDYELSCRLFKYNHKIEFAPLSINYDEKPATFEIMLRQRARWSRGFLNLLNKKVIKFTDILGLIYWLNPIAALIGITILFVYGYSAIHGLVMGYYPYNYAYFPFNLWILMIGVVFIMQFAVLVKEYGIKGLNYNAYLILYNAFSLYFLVAFIKGLFVKSWGDTKTAHGFTKDNNR